MIVTTLYIFSVLTLIVGAVLLYLYKHLHFKPMKYKKHRNVNGELELPPLGKDWEYKEDHIQEKPDILLDITV